MDDEVVTLRTARQLLAAKLLQERTTVLRQAHQIEVLTARLQSTRDQQHESGESNGAQLELERLRRELDASLRGNGSIRGNSDDTAIKATLSDAQGEIARLNAALKVAQTPQNNSDAQATVAQLQAEIDEKDSLILEQDAIIEEERRLVRQLTAERDECDRLIADKERELARRRASSGEEMPSEAIVAEHENLKAQFALEMEKKKQFSVVFLKLKAEFDEQKKKIAQQAALLTKLGHTQ